MWKILKASLIGNSYNAILAMIATYNEDFNKWPQPSQKGTCTRPMFLFCLFIEGNGTCLLHLTYERESEREGNHTDCFQRIVTIYDAQADAIKRIINSGG